MGQIRVEDTFGGLCQDCKYGSKHKSLGQNRMFVFCSSYERDVAPQEVCDRYRHRNFVELYDMQKTAWVIRTDKKNQIGFRSPAERKNDPDKQQDYEEVHDLERLLPNKLKEL